MSYKVIEASEIAEYVYCNRAWWLRTELGYTPQNAVALAEGTAYHRHHGQNLDRATNARRVALILLFLAVAITVFWLVRSA